MNTVGNQGLRLGKETNHNLQGTQNGVDHHTHPSAALGGLLHLRRDFRFVGIGIRGGVHGARAPWRFLSVGWPYHYTASLMQA